VSGGSAADRTRAFRERARLEADRYGPDPWIFVRELLQNSRDAGARTVTFTVEDGPEVARVLCHDDGEGMTFEHARRYLFSLYASSKEDAKNQAGKFGVGFWSVLRFEPVTITVRSRPRVGEPWGLRLDGDLERATFVAPLDRPGTEIVLERARGDGRLEHRIFDAVWQSARYLHHRDDPDEAVSIAVNGRPANAEFTLAAPSAAFRRGSVRGVVGLGPAPRVELFCRGLRVRSAACLEDLLAPAGRHTSRMRVSFPELPGGLAPQALLMSDRLEVLLSRADARDNRALQRLVRLAQRELEQLVDRQLAHARPQPWWRRAIDWVVGELRRSLLVRTVAGSVVGACMAAALSIALWGDGRGNGGAVSTEEGEVAVAAPANPRGPRPYRDLGTRYRGPKVDVLAPGSAEPVDLHYRPPDRRFHFAALTFPRLSADGSPVHEAIVDALQRYETTECEDDCVDIELPIRTNGGAVRIPVPTGHRIVAGSTRIGDEPVRLQATFDGHPAIVVEGARDGILRYRSAARADRSLPTESKVALPPELARVASQLRRGEGAPVRQRVDMLTEIVRKRVRYDRSAEVADNHARAAAQGIGFIDRTLAIEAGDCDVQNGLLVALLQASGVPSRLAVGYLGVDGGALPWLHAWVEFQTEDGDWHVADASDGAAEAGAAVARAGEPEEVVYVEDDAPETAAAAPLAGAGETRTASRSGSRPKESPVSEPDDTVSRGAGASDGSHLGWLRSLDRRAPWAVRALPIATLLVAIWLLLGGRTRRAIKLDDSADLSRLLQGVLQQPGAFGHVAALFHRPLVPLIDGDALSLHRARELAARGRLFRTRGRPDLAMLAIRSGAAVLDDQTAEGRTVADALGAVDLDRWNALLERAYGDRLVEGINNALRARGEDWGIRLADDVPGGVMVLDLAPLGVRFPGIRGARLVMVDARESWLAHARTQPPRTAVFYALDHLVERIGLPDDRRRRLLAEGARAALLESFAG
jgi:hypothetical protein